MGRRATPGPVDSVEGAHGRAELLRDADRRAAWMLLVDGVPQSHVDLEDPGYLDFEYVRRLGHVIDTAAPPGQPLRVLHLGAGALTLARYVAASRPGSPQLAVEVDAALVDLVRLRLPLRRGRVRVRVGDAREVLERLPRGSYDVVIADVFAAGRTPAHLTTVEFVNAVRRVLSEGGVFAANVADGAPLAHSRAQVATARAVFPQVALMADAGVLRGRRFGNLVLVASPEPLPAGTAHPAGGGGSDAWPRTARRRACAVHGGREAGHRRGRQPLPRPAARRVRRVSAAAGPARPDGGRDGSRAWPGRAPRPAPGCPRSRTPRAAAAR